MKPKWIVTYWDMKRDCVAKQGKATYEEAMTFAAKCKAKGHSNVQVKLRGT